MINRNPPISNFDKRSYIVNSKLKDNEELQTYNVPEEIKEYKLNDFQFSVKPAIQYNKYINPANELPIPTRFVGQPPPQYVKQFLTADKQDDPFSKYDIEQARMEKINLDKANKFYDQYKMEKSADERLYYQYHNRMQHGLNNIVNHPNNVLQPEDYVIIQNRLLARDQTIINDYNILYAIVNTPQLLQYVQNNIANRTGPQNISYYHILKASLLNTFRQLRIPIPLWLDANPSNNPYNDLHQNTPLNRDRESGVSMENINFNAEQGHPVQTGEETYEIERQPRMVSTGTQTTRSGNVGRPARGHEHRPHIHSSPHSHTPQQQTDAQEVISAQKSEQNTNNLPSGHTSGDRDDEEIAKDTKQTETLPVSHDLPQNTYDHLFRRIRSLLNGTTYEEAKQAMGRDLGRSILSGQFGPPGTYILDTYANIRRQYPREEGWNSIYRLLLNLRMSDRGLPHISDTFINQYKQYFETETRSVLPGSLDVPEEIIAPQRNLENTYRRFVNYIINIINNNPRVDTASKRNSLLIPLSRDIENGQYGPNDRDIKYLYDFYKHRSDTNESINYSMADILRRVITNIVARRYTHIMTVEFERKFVAFFF